MKLSKSEVIGNYTMNVLAAILAAVCLYPMLYVLFASFSDPGELAAVSGLLWKPAGFSLAGYAEVLSDMKVWIGYGNTIFYVAVGTAMNVFCSAMLAYGMTKTKAFWVNKITIFIIFTMFFNGGMIPTYLNIKNLGMLDSRWAILLPGLISTYNLIVLRTGFQSIPTSLEESAQIDGANDIYILFRIVIPLSLPTVAVMFLFYGVGRWNSWFDAMMYLQDRDKFPLQLILREILINSSLENSQSMAMSGDRASLQEVIKYSTVIVATVPILCLYPFLQKYFVSGIMIGAVKG